jgi:putative endonuclease
MKNNSWFVYILECTDGTYYTGITKDLDKRMDAHSSGKGSKYVYKKGFKKLLFAKPCKNRSEASKKEYLIKKLPRKEKLNWFKI